MSEMPIVRLCRLSPRRGLHRGEQPVHRGAADAEPLCDLRCALAVALELPDLTDIDRSGTARVDASRLGLCDAFELTLAPEICLELGEDPKHAQEGFAARRARDGGDRRRVGSPMGMTARRTGAGQKISGRASPRLPCRAATPTSWGQMTANRLRRLMAATPPGSGRSSAALILMGSSRPPSRCRRRKPAR